MWMESIDTFLATILLTFSVFVFIINQGKSFECSTRMHIFSYVLSEFVIFGYSKLE